MGQLAAVLDGYFAAPALPAGAFDREPAAVARAEVTLADATGLAVRYGWVIASAKW